MKNKKIIIYVAIWLAVVAIFYAIHMLMSNPAATTDLSESFMIKGVCKLPFKFLGSEVWITTSDISSWLITIMILIFGIVLGSKISKSDAPSGIQNFVEMAVEALNSMGDGILGPNRNRFINYIGTIFIFILISNLSGLIGLRSPTADYATTFCLGMFTFAIVQYQGIKNHGIGHFTSLFQPVPVLFPINLIGEIANPISISLRLFANMLSGVIMLGLWYGMIPLVLKIAVPSFLHAYCDLFSGCIQTYVFCMLTMVYVNDKL